MVVKAHNLSKNEIQRTKSGFLKFQYSLLYSLLTDAIVNQNASFFQAISGSLRYLRSSKTAVAIQREISLAFRNAPFARDTL